MKKLIVTGAILGVLLLGLSGYFLYQLEGAVIGGSSIQLELLQQ